MTRPTHRAEVSPLRAKASRGIHAKAGGKHVDGTELKGKTVHIGCYAIEQDAARAYQEYVEHGTLPARAAPTSTFRGVSWHKGKRKWQVKISIQER
jgi:hypothetical protein